MRLLLVRHGETAWNAVGRLQGQTPLPLNARGQRQAVALTRAIATESVQAVYSSDLQRARQTAHSIATALGLLVQHEAGWREMAFGRWEGLTWAEIQQRDPAALAAWQADSLHVAPPEGETLAQVHERVKAAFAGLIAAHQGHTVVVVSHGGPLRLLLCLTLGLPPQAHWRFMLHPGSLSALHLDEPGVVLTRLNYVPGWSD
jgi:2,3-bisphosphoglycerate-dependent phosphoglycerate mutase